MTDFDFAIIVKSIPFLLEGMALTLLLTLFAIVGGLALGVVLALCGFA